MVVTGESGTATRLATGLVGLGSLGRPVRDFLGASVVDEWLMTASDPLVAPMRMSAIGVDTVVVFAITCVDEAALAVYQRMGLPAALAVTAVVLQYMPCRDYPHVRASLRRLAKLAVGGTLPIAPCEPAHERMWAVAIAVVADVDSTPDAEHAWGKHDDAVRAASTPE